MKRACVIVVLFSLLLASCSRDYGTESTNEVIPFSSIDDNLQESINSQSWVEISGNEVDVYYLDDMLIEDYGISSVNIYRANFISSRQYPLNLPSDGWNELDFNYKWYFGDNEILDVNSVVYPSSSLAFETMNSVTSDIYIGGDGTTYRALMFDLPYSGLPKSFENLQGDNMENIDMWDVNATIDGVPITHYFENVYVNVYTWPGVVDIFWGHIDDAVMVMKGNQVLLFPRGDFSITETVAENLQIISFDSISEAVIDAITFNAQSILVDTAYVFAARLMYYPAGSYSIELGETIDCYYDYQSGEYDANVTLLPVWIVYYVGEFNGHSSLYAIPINAVTGETMISEYSMMDFD